jgi:hypothetical protein
MNLNKESVFTKFEELLVKLSKVKNKSQEGIEFERAGIFYANLIVIMEYSLKGNDGHITIIDEYNGLLSEYLGE